MLGGFTGDPIGHVSSHSINGPFLFDKAGVPLQPEIFTTDMSIAIHELNAWFAARNRRKDFARGLAVVRMDEIDERP